MSQNILALAFLAAVFIGILYAGLSSHTPQPVAQPERRPYGTCHVRGCGVKTYDKVTRYDSGTDEWTCTHCRYEGEVLGYWSGEVASA